MKKFSFPLDRALSWRQTQTRLEEAKLAHLRSELESLDLRGTALDRSVREAGSGLLAAVAKTAIEIGALEHFRASTSAETRNLQRTRLSLEQKLSEQTQTVLERRRGAQLLEKLRQRQQTAWQAAAQREIDRQAEESFLARIALNAVE